MKTLFKIVFCLSLLSFCIVWVKIKGGYDFENILAKPSLAHPLGTDDLGKDVLAKIILAIFKSFKVIALTLLISFSLSTLIGIPAGYLQGKLEFAVMRIIEVLSSLPTIPTIISLLIIFQHNVLSISIALSAAIIPEVIYSIMIKSSEVSSSDFIQVYKVMGVSQLRIMFKHILKNILPHIKILFFSSLIFCIILETNISYIGFGYEETIGKIISDNRKFIITREGLWNIISPLAILSFSIFISDIISRDSR